MVCVFCGRRYGQVPITFLIGFYVSEVVRRYWDQFMSLPFTDRLALKLVTFVPGKDTFPRHLRRAVMRYVNLSIVLVFRLVSTKVHSRYFILPYPKLCQLLRFEIENIFMLQVP